MNFATDRVIPKERKEISQYKLWIFSLRQFSEKDLKIFVKERFSILLLSQSYKTSANNAKEVSHATVVGFLLKFNFFKRFMFEKKNHFDLQH